MALAKSIPSAGAPGYSVCLAVVIAILNVDFAPQTRQLPGGPVAA